MDLTQDEKNVRAALTEIYPQLIINCEKVCGAGFKKHGHDLLALAIEMFLEKEIEYQLKVINDNKLENFITYVMNFQLKHATTRYYHHYRKHNEKQRELFDNKDYVKMKAELDNPFPHAFENQDDDLMLCVKRQIEFLNPYEGMLIKEYVINGNNFNEIAERYDIGYFHLKKDLTKVLKEIKQECQHLR